MPFAQIDREARDELVDQPPVAVTDQSALWVVPRVCEFGHGAGLALPAARLPRDWRDLNSAIAAQRGIGGVANNLQQPGTRVGAAETGEIDQIAHHRLLEHVFASSLLRISQRSKLSAASRCGNSRFEEVGARMGQHADP
jgi:hypothetical protein